jgi:hypothetical protein
MTLLKPFSGDELRQLRAVEEAGIHDMQEGGHHSSSLFLIFNFFCSCHFFNLSPFSETVVLDPHWSQCESEYGSRLSHTGSKNLAFPEPDPGFLSKNLHSLIKIFKL